MSAAGLYRLRPFWLFAPHDFPACRLNARERRVGLVPSIKPVEIAIPVNRRVEMQSKLLCRPQLPASEIRPNLDKRASCSVAGRDEHLVVEDDGTRCIDGLVRAAAPWKGEIDSPVRWIDRHQPAGRRIRLASGKHEHAPPSVDHCGNRR